VPHLENEQCFGKRNKQNKPKKKKKFYHHTQEFRESKIGDLDKMIGLPWQENNVFELEVAMDDALLVQVLDSEQYLFEVDLGRFFGQGAVLLDELEQITIWCTGRCATKR